jgi:Metallo-peptidase family M12B Reprolysin-like/FG-GAP-like repeat
MSKRSFQGVFFFLSIILFAANAFASSDDVWQEINDSNLKQRPMDRQITPNVYKTFGLNRAALDDVLTKAPMEFTDAARLNPVILTLPMPDGTLARFVIENSPIMEPGLAAKFPEIQTYRGQGIDDKTATVRFDVTQFGFHAMIMSREGTTYIDPYAKGDTSNYISYHKDALGRNDKNHVCLVGRSDNPIISKVTEFRFMGDEAGAADVTNGATLRTYRLALAATGEYTTVFGGTVSGAMAAMTTSMNRVNQVYEKDVAVRMVMVANNNLIVYTNGATDPYANDDGFTMLGQNQTNIDTVIGSANYDVGHVFSTGGGGVASLSVPCSAGSKARGVTGLPNPVGDGFDIDFVAHEMGHQFGGNHTFNTSCGGNRSAGAAYEPGSGITIMGYAGVCGAQDLALHSIDTFHVRSLEEIVGFLNTGGGCAAATATGNTAPTVTITGGSSYNIPKQTPFTLAATATDPNGDTVTFDWQEYDLGPATSAIPNSDSDGTARPIFRPYLPTTGARTFPQLSYILANANVPPSTYSGGLLTGELLPAITRTMNFQVIARDNRANGGGINTATATVTVSGTSGPFAITAPNTGVTWAAGSQTVTWNVNGTSGAPVNATGVKISMSTDGGNTFPTVLAANTPNDGSQVVTIPVGNTTTARIKVEAVGNIFFDISDVNFTVSGVAAPPKSRADFDGDGKTDLSVFRPSEGNWYLQRSTDGFLALNWGLSGDKLVPGYYDNDSKTDTAVFRPSNTAGVADFYILNSNGLTGSYIEWGNVGDIPVVGDYDGDGKSDAAVYRPSTGIWYINKSSGGVTITPFGGASDVPVVGDFDGDGKSDITIYRSATAQWLGTLSGGGTTNVVFGTLGDILVPADYDNDNADNFAVYRPSTGQWRYISGASTITKSWGISTDIPVPGDYDGDGSDDVAIYRNGTWYVDRSQAGILIQSFGLSSDNAVPKAYIP